MNKPNPIAFKKIPTLSVLKESYPGIKGLFFDMDGTLFNTEPYHTEAMVKLGRDHNIRSPYPQEMVHELLVGRADHLVFDIIRTWEGFPQHWSVADFVNAKTMNLLGILDEVEPKKYFPLELFTLLTEARASDFFLALVTSSEKIVTQKLLQLAGISHLFHATLTRDDCPQHKPHPWPYLKALRESTHEASEIIIFEDSSVGIEAARASGSHVIKVEWY